MSRYQIVPTITEERMEDGLVVFEARGLNSTAVQKDNLRVVGKTKDGSVRFLTGLKKEHLQNSSLLTEDEKKRYIAQLAEDLKTLKAKNITAEDIEDDNMYFWHTNRRGEIILDPSIKDRYFDTELNPQHIFYKYAILSGSYDIVAPSRDKALENNIPFYFTSIEEEANRTLTPTTNKLELAGRLSNFIKNNSEMNIIHFTWALDKETKGLTKTNGMKMAVDVLVDFMDGKRGRSGAKKAQEKISKLLDEWNENPADVVLKAVVAASIDYGFIMLDKGINSYVLTGSSTKLGNTTEEVIATLKNPDFREESKDLIDQVKKELER